MEGAGEGGGKKNTAVFVSGLPQDASLGEIAEYFGKYGVIMDDMFTGGPRIKLYTASQEAAVNGEEAAFNGEALVVYLREESARMAAAYLDESYFRPNVTIHVSIASFGGASEGATDEAAGKKRAVEKGAWKEAMQRMQKKLAWTTESHGLLDEGSSDEEELAAAARSAAKHRRIVVIRNMFGAGAELETAEEIEELRQDVRSECERIGAVTSVKVLVGAAACAVKFAHAESAEACLLVMDGRFFGGRRLTAALYDGRMSLKEAPPPAGHGLPDGGGGAPLEEEARIDSFGKWLESQDHEGSD